MIKTELNSKRVRVALLGAILIAPLMAISVTPAHADSVVVRAAFGHNTRGQHRDSGTASGEVGDNTRDGFILRRARHDLRVVLQGRHFPRINRGDQVIVNGRRDGSTFYATYVRVTSRH